MEEPAANIFQWFGAGLFGAVIGWYTYYINRYRTGAFALNDIGTLIGVLGGAGVMALFPARTSLFAAYGVGLGIGFFGYFLMLNFYVLLSRRSENQAFSWEWFLDGRRKRLAPDEYIPEGTRPTVTPMLRPANVEGMGSDSPGISPGIPASTGQPEAESAPAGGDEPRSKRPPARRKTGAAGSTSDPS